MKWYRIFLTNEQIMQGVHIQLQNQFSSIWLKMQANENAAMFDEIRSTEKGKYIYFSPGASIFFIDNINQYMGVEVDAPNITSVALLVGRDSAWNLLKKNNIS